MIEISVIEDRVSMRVRRNDGTVRTLTGSDIAWISEQATSGTGGSAEMQRKRTRNALDTLGISPADLEDIRSAARLMLTERATALLTNRAPKHSLTYRSPRRAIHRDQRPRFSFAALRAARNFGGVA